jgi:hypothetical protein
MTLGRGLLGVGLLAVVAALLAAAFLSLAPIGDAAPHPFNHDRNAVWLAHRWLEKEHTTEQMETLLSGLARRGVTYVYPHLIPFDSSGRLPRHNREQMRSFLAVARRVAPEIKVLPWVGGLRVGYKRTIQGTVDLADMRQRQMIVAECRGLVDEGFDGVHVNVEPIAEGNSDFLALLRAIRTAVGPDRILSLSATKPGPISLPVARNFFWTKAYYESVGAVADQIVVMAYDTGLPTPLLYRRYVSYAADKVTSELVLSHARARVLIGIPSYDETGLMHRAGVETLENALLGCVAGLRGVGGGGTFEGVALYAEWTTDPEEWAVYERVWRGQEGAALPAPPVPGSLQQPEPSGQPVEKDRGEQER